VLGCRIVVLLPNLLWQCGCAFVFQRTDPVRLQPRLPGLRGAIPRWTPRLESQLDTVTTQCFLSYELQNTHRSTGMLSRLFVLRVVCPIVHTEQCIRGPVGAFLMHYLSPPQLIWHQLRGQHSIPLNRAARFYQSNVNNQQNDRTATPKRQRYAKIWLDERETNNKEGLLCTRLWSLLVHYRRGNF